MPRTGDFSALLALGMQAAQRGDLVAAAKHFAHAVAANPRSAEAHAALGQAQRGLGQMAEALASFERTIALRPDRPDAHFGRGIALRNLGRGAEALASFDKALALKRDYVDALNSRGNVLLDLRRPDEALLNYDAAVAARPDYADAWSNRGNALMDLQRPGDALASFDKALALRPNYAEAHNNRGMALRSLDRQAEALAEFERALAFKKEFPEALLNRGSVLRELARYADALANYDAALRQRPDYPDARQNRGMVRLLLGDFARGWPDFELRLRTHEAARAREYKQPRWRGEGAIAGKTILLHAEQGFGDTIQFCRYAEAVAALGARVVLAVPPALKRLLTGLRGVAAVAASDAETGAFDWHCPLPSLPLALKTTISSIPAAIPYLAAPADRVQAWSKRLGAGARPRIGLAWSGNPKHKNDRNRSIALRRFAALGGLKASVVSLQKHMRADDAATLAEFAWLAPFGGELTDFADTAALIAQLDLVISVDSAVAHLAGALGKPVWILLPHVPDWRWLIGRDDSPWYPTARLFRQPAIGDWDGVFEKIQAALADLSAKMPAP